MNDTLFPLPECPSPRLAWLMEHGVSTHFVRGDEDGWGASIGIPPDVAAAYGMEEVGKLCWGYTEHEAISRLAQRQGWKLWNE